MTYLELRTTPRALPCPSPQPPSLYVSTILSAVSDFEAAHPGARGAGTMRTRLILSVDRRHTPAQAHETVHLAAEFRDRGVVGVDLCGDPSARCHGADGRGSEDVSVFREAFAEAARLGLGITIHFGEAECSGHPAELAEILSWRPGRLGHVIHLGEDVKREITARGLGLELCLSCNVHAGMVMGGFEGHHFGEWWGVEGSLISLGVGLTCFFFVPHPALLSLLLSCCRFDFFWTKLLTCLCETDGRRGRLWQFVVQRVQVGRGALQPLP